jgi:hypothetical protein
VGVAPALSLTCGSVELSKELQKLLVLALQASLLRARVRSLWSPIHLLCYCRRYYCLTSNVFVQYVYISFVSQLV